MFKVFFFVAEGKLMNLGSFQYGNKMNYSLKIKPFEWVTIFFTLLIAGISSWFSVLAISSGKLITSIDSIFLGNVPIVIDSLAAWFVLIINFTVITGLFYGIGYLKAYNAPKWKLAFHWVMFSLFHLSMLLVCVVQNGLVFLIVWEIMSLSSGFVVLFDSENPSTLKAGINYLVQMHISVVLLTVGFIWIYNATGTFDFQGIATFFSTNKNIWVFLIFFLGFGIKAGFIPLHSWLPHAHPAAPSHVSGVMSGVIVKLGIYGIFRIIQYLSSDFIILGEIILILSLLTGLFGILNASVHRDFKRQLAYCTIENIGIVGIGIGTGLLGIGLNSPALYFLGFGGALLHVLNHSLFKSLLFYSAGSIYQKTHTRDMDKLGGLIKNMPQTGLLFLIGTIAISGIPPFNGFISEFLIYSGIIQGASIGSIGQTVIFVLSLAGLSIIGGLALLAFTKSFSVIFLGESRNATIHNVTEVSPLMLIPQYLIVFVMLLIAFFPSFFIKGVAAILNDFSLIQISQTPLDSYVTLLTSIAIFSGVFVLIILLLWGFRRLSVQPESPHSCTWGCGYVAPNSRMQYTGKSFAKSLGKLFNFLLIERKKYKELEKGEIFPIDRDYSSHYNDFFEFKLIKPSIKHMLFGSNYLGFLQNGRIQWYVLYGIVFVLGIFIATIFNLM